MDNEDNVSIISLFADRVAVRDYAKEKATANPAFSYTTLSNGPFYDLVCPSSIRAACKGTTLASHGK